MSNPLKGIKKVFKAVVKPLKKIILPVLAVAAVVLTGGAALGVLPALGGAGGLLASAGISGPLAGILTSAANAATFGAIGAAVTGKNIVKGATMGFVTGGVLGGIGAATGLPTSVPGPASGRMLPSTDAILKSTNNIVDSGLNVAGTANQAIEAGLASAPVPGIGAASLPASSALPASTALPAAAMEPLARAPVVGAARAAAPATQAAQTAATAPAQNGGGFLGFFDRHPTLTGMALQGIGGAMAASADAKAGRADRRSYMNYQPLYSQDEVRSLDGLPQAGEYYNEQIYGRLKVDPRLGIIPARNN